MLFSQKLYLYIIIAIVAGVAIYCFNPWQLYFQNDDFTHILLSSKGVLFQRNSFRPVCDLSVMLDYALWGKNPVGYHITNLVLHVICSWLVYAFSKKMFVLYYGLNNKPTFAFIAALLFFIYPMHSESVFWILGRSGTLGAIFSLLFLLFFVREEYTRFSIAAYLFFYSIALLTYESCWPVPLAAMVLLAGRGQQLRDVIKSRKYHFITIGVVFIVYLFLRYKVTHEIFDNYEAGNFLHVNAATLVKSFLQLIIRSFAAYIETPVIITAAFGVLLIIVLYWLIKKATPVNSTPLYIVVCFLLCLLPYLSVGIDTHGTEGERFLYLPSVFVCLLVALVLYKMPGMVATVVVCFACVTYTSQLYINACNYRFAGNIVKQTLTAINGQPNGKDIVMEGLPKAQHGALILESGLADAVELFQLHKRNINVQILSARSETRPLQHPYKTIYQQPVDQEAVTQYIFTDSALIIYR